MSKTTSHTSADHAADDSCPTCQTKQSVERQIEDGAARRFRLFVVLYLAYPAIILTLLTVIGAGAYAYLTKESYIDYAELPPEPVWCGSGAAQVFYPPASARDGGYESALPPSGQGGANSFGPAVGIAPDMFGGSVQIAASAATDRVRYYVYESIRAADGSPDARYRRDTMGLTPAELAIARQRFADRSRQDGKLGFLRLGIAQLGLDAFNIAASNKLTVPFCRPNDFSAPDPTQAYVSFAVANMCDSAQATRAQDWLAAVAEHEGFTPEQRAALDLQAHGYLAAGLQVCVPQYVSDVQGTGPPGGDFGSVDDDVDMPAAPDRPRREGLSARRAGPAGGATDDDVAAAYSRQLLNLGDAALAEGRLNRARRWWLRSIEAGKAVGAQPAITAQKRLQTHTLTCHFSDQSLAAISRDYKALSGDLIHPKVIQQALHALGHYDGPINGNFGPVSRAAIRKFQREMEFDETDTLTPLQTVYVICNAAETARDASSQNALGIMYATGLGVEQNIDLALEWLRAASTRRHPDATYNLALLYGTGIVLNSFRMCDIPQSPEQADQYLREAGNQGHPRAIDLLTRYGSKSGEESSRKRWRVIEKEELENAKSDKTGIYAKRLATIGTKCAPDRNVR